LCGKRLKAASPLWLPHYEAEHGALPEAVSARLLTASASTLDRLLKASRVAHPKGLRGTKPGTLLKKQIPIRCEHWDVSARVKVVVAWFMWPTPANCQRPTACL
jgi:hypothetical protein